MHAEAVKYGSKPSKPGLIQDETRALTCDECNVKYRLYYDNEAAMSSTFCGILAREIITARHPNHGRHFVLEVPQKPEQPRQLVWASRMDLGKLLKNKPRTP
jgi:hypothetical protein